MNPTSSIRPPTSSAGSSGSSTAHGPTGASTRREALREADHHARNLSEARGRRGLDEPRFELPEEEPTKEEPRPEAVTVPLPPERDPLSAKEQAKQSLKGGGDAIALDGEKASAKSQGQADGADELVEDGRPEDASAEGVDTAVKRPHLAARGATQEASQAPAVDANGVAIEVEASTDSATTPFEAARQKAMLLATQTQAAPVAQSALAAAITELYIQPDEDAEATLSTLEAEALGIENPDGEMTLDGLDLRPTERVFGPSGANGLAGLNLPQSQAPQGVASEVADAVSRLVVDARDDAQGVLRFRTETGQTFYAQTRVDPTGQQQVELRLTSDDPGVRALLLERLSDLRSALSRVGFADAQVSVERDFSGQDPRREAERTEEPNELQPVRRRSPFTQNTDGPAAPGRLHLII